PDVDQLQRAGVVGDVLRRRARRRVDEGAAADATADKALGFQLVEGGADSGARRAEGLGELTLGRQLVAVAVLASLDRLPQLSGDPGGPAHRVIHQLHHDRSLSDRAPRIGFGRFYVRMTVWRQSNNNQSNPFLCLFKNWFVTGLQAAIVPKRLSSAAG